jgi:hypothetical protein
MADAPAIKYSGQGSRLQAAELGRTISDGVAGAFAARTEPLHIDTLLVQIPAGASKRDIVRAIRLAIARRTTGGGP